MTALEQTLLQSARCRGCGYALRGLNSCRCPECGQTFDPSKKWTMRLPLQPGRLLRTLARPQGGFELAIASVAVLLAAWGSRYPGFGSFSLQLGIVVGAACWLGWLFGRMIRFPLVLQGWIPDDTNAARRTERRFVCVLALIPVLVILRPTMHLCFLISMPTWARTAEQIQAQPFPQGLPNGGWAGCYYVARYRKCPHGIAIYVISKDWNAVQFGEEGFWEPIAFVYKSEDGDCSKFRSGRPMGGKWHLEGWW
jgi:hypothetical protein